MVELAQFPEEGALVAQDPKKMGYLAVETLMRHLNGEKVPKFIDTGVELVTKEKLANDKAIRELDYQIQPMEVAVKDNYDWLVKEGLFAEPG